MYFIFLRTEKRLLSFKTGYFGTMGLVQDTHINMPFQSWELRPRGTNQAQLTIIAAIIEVDIQIKVSQGQLYNSNNNNNNNRSMKIS